MVLGTEDLMKRELVETVFPFTRVDEFQQLLSSPQGLYCGFDPTADSLHIGNLVSILALIHGQRAGHRPIAVIGGATGLIGDPSGKERDREPMKAEDIENNIVKIMENVERVFQNHAQHISHNSRGLTPVKILNNRDWYKAHDVISFMSTNGRYFRLGEMISRSSVQSRLNSKWGISLTEFMYQVFQSYDWLHLFQHHNCSIQIGGNDQTGNIISGFDLVHGVTEKFVFGFTVPLLLSQTGVKLGKTEGNSVWLDPDKTSPYQFYQYFLNVSDASVEKYLKLLTVLGHDEIQSIMKQQIATPDKRPGQKKLAEQVTLLVHGDSGLKLAQQCTEVLFGDGLTHLRQMKIQDLQQLFDNAATFDVPYNPKMNVKELGLAIGCFSKPEEAERVIKSGGLKINQIRVTDPLVAIETGEFVLPNNITLVKMGKKRYYMVRWLM